VASEHPRNIPDFGRKTGAGRVNGGPQEATTRQLIASGHWPRSSISTIGSSHYIDRTGGRGGGRASAALPLLDELPHRLRRGALDLPIRRSRQNGNLFLREPSINSRVAPLLMMMDWPAAKSVTPATLISFTPAAAAAARVVAGCISAVVVNAIREAARAPVGRAWGRTFPRRLLPCLRRAQARGFSLLAANPMGERLMATPALSGGRMYVRGEHTLFAVGQAR